MLDAAARVLSRRSASLRDKAAGLTSTIPDKDGRDAAVIDSRGCVAIGTADLLDAIGADLFDDLSSTDTRTAA